VSYLATCTEIAKITEGFPGYVFGDTPVAELKSQDSDPWLAVVRNFTRKSAKADNRLRRLQGDEMRALETVEVKEPLQRVPESPWRSLGGFLDYSNWHDRERFLELDRAIAQSAREPEDESSAQIV
jgi:hypothetical protein